MKPPTQILLAAAVWLSLALTTRAATVNTWDWKFSASGNPTALDASSSTNYWGGTVVATFRGTNNTYYVGTGPGGSNGYFGPPTGLWEVINGDLLLELCRTAYTPVNLTLVITHFVDGQVYPGIAFFDGNGIESSMWNWTTASRNVVVPQVGNMGGFWASDTYTWSQVNFNRRLPITLDIIPGTGSGGAMLLDEVQFTIEGDLTFMPPPPTLALVVDRAFGLGITGTLYARYRVEYRTSLTTGSWLPLTSGILIPGTNYVLSNPFNNGPSAFYRAVWAP
jgi:hypothetical protein